MSQKLNQPNSKSFSKNHATRGQMICQIYSFDIGHHHHHHFGHLQVNLLFEACMRHETLWELLVQKEIK